MAESTTARSKHYLEKQGWRCWNVEQTVRIPASPGRPASMFKRDCFNIADLLLFHAKEKSILLVQSTTAPNQAARVAKIKATADAEGWLKARGRIQVHGWHKKNGSWIVNIFEIEMDKEFSGLTATNVTIPLFQESA